MYVMTIREKERQVIDRAVRDLLAAGFLVGVFDGEAHTLRPQREPQPVLAALWSVDEEYLTVYTPERYEREVKAGGPVGIPGRGGWVLLVHGNDGSDVIADHSASLEPHLAGAQLVADALAAARA
jgi:hypothetical protein